MGGLFKPSIHTPGSSIALQQLLIDAAHGKFTGVEGQSLKQIFDMVNQTVGKGQGFFGSLIPSAPGQLSEAAAAEKSQASDALQRQLQNQSVAQQGNLQRMYGGRLPASQAQMGFGSLARSGAEGATDIARQAIQENVRLGEQGVQGMSGLSQLSTLPMQTIGGLTSQAPSGQVAGPSPFSQIGQMAAAVGGAIAGMPGLGGGGGGGGGGVPQTGGISNPSVGRISGMSNPLSGGFPGLNTAPPSQQYPSWRIQPGALG